MKYAKWFFLIYLQDAAAKAKKFGTKLGPDVELKILWRQLPVKERKPMSASKTTVTETAIAQPRESDELPRKHVNTVPKKVPTDPTL